MSIIELKSGLLSIEINPLGAELISFRKQNTNFIWKIDETFWNKTSPVLFPIVGRLRNDIYKIHDKTYQLTRHGFARELLFEIEKQSPNSVTFLLKDSAETLEKFPFQFELRISYTLEENSLKFTYNIKNKSKEKMPFSIGAHPAFSIDLHQSKYSILFESETKLVNHELENELFSGKTTQIKLINSTLPLNYSFFEKDALVLKDLKTREITIYKDNNPYLRFDLGGFPHLGIWTKSNAPFLCIEPWCGYADKFDSNGDIFEKEAIQILQEEETFSTYFSTEIL
jgi:galactose mutarotase-like enzyme